MLYLVFGFRFQGLLDPLELLFVGKLPIVLGTTGAGIGSSEALLDKLGHVMGSIQLCWGRNTWNSGFARSEFGRRLVRDIVRVLLPVSIQ